MITPLIRPAVPFALVAATPPAVTTNTAQAVPAPTITTGSKQLVNQLPFVDPIYVGYKGTQSFIPATVANKKDRSGGVFTEKFANCSHRQQDQVQIVEASHSS